MTPTRDQILAASAGWVAVALNLFPGVGSGYLYQRRWKAYWITVALAVSLVVAINTAPSQNKSKLLQIAGLGLMLLGPVTAVEAGLAVKKVRETS